MNGIDKPAKRHAPRTPLRQLQPEHRRIRAYFYQSQAPVRDNKKLIREHETAVVNADRWSRPASPRFRRQVSPKPGTGQITISPIAVRGARWRIPAPHVKRRSRSWRGPGGVASTRGTEQICHAIGASRNCPSILGPSQIGRGSRDINSSQIFSRRPDLEQVTVHALRP